MTPLYQTMFRALRRESIEHVLDKVQYSGAIDIYYTMMDNINTGSVIEYIKMRLLEDAYRS